MAKQSAQARAALSILNFFFRTFLNVVFYGVVAFGIYYAATNVYDFCYQITGDATCEEEPGRDVTVQIKKGETTMAVCTKLESYKIVKNKYSFYLKIQLFEYKIMPGTFELNTSMTYNEILEVITDISNSIAEEEEIK